MVGHYVRADVRRERFTTWRPWDGPMPWDGRLEQGGARTVQGKTLVGIYVVCQRRFPGRVMDEASFRRAIRLTYHSPHVGHASTDHTLTLAVSEPHRYETFFSVRRCFYLL